LPDPVRQQSFRHWGGFFLSGGTAFLVDSAVTLALVELAGLGRFSARLAGILVAMVVAWLMHRNITFAVRAPPTLGEFGRFAAVAWMANALNYVVYLVILLLWPATPTLIAIVIATAIAAIFSYAGFRLGVFREPPPVA
jgi:putative flippase GtrA